MHGTIPADAADVTTCLDRIGPPLLFGCEDAGRADASVSQPSTPSTPRPSPPDRAAPIQKRTPRSRRRGLSAKCAPAAPKSSRSPDSVIDDSLPPQQPTAQPLARQHEQAGDTEDRDVPTTDTDEPTPPQRAAPARAEPLIRHSADAANPTSTHARALLIYTGGTLGMRRGEHGALLPAGRGCLGESVGEMAELRHVEMPEVDLIEWSPLLDSSSVGPCEWGTIANQARAQPPRSPAARPFAPSPTLRYA